MIALFVSVYLLGVMLCWINLMEMSMPYAPMSPERNPQKRFGLFLISFTWPLILMFVILWAACLFAGWSKDAVVIAWKGLWG